MKYVEQHNLPRSRFPCWQFNLILWSLLSATSLVFFAGIGPAYFLGPVAIIESSVLHGVTLDLGNSKPPVIISRIEIGTWCSDILYTDADNQEGKYFECDVLWPKLKQVLKPLCKSAQSGSAKPIGNGLRQLGFCTKQGYATIPTEIVVSQALSLLYILFLFLALSVALLPLVCCGKDLYYARQKSLKNFGISLTVWSAILAIACTVLSAAWVLKQRIIHNSSDTTTSNTIHISMASSPVLRTGISAALLAVFGAIGFGCFPTQYPTYDDSILGDFDETSWESDDTKYHKDSSLRFSTHASLVSFPGSKQENSKPLLFKSRQDRGYFTPLP